MLYYYENTTLKFLFLRYLVLYIPVKFDFSQKEDPFPRYPLKFLFVKLQFMAA